MKLSFDEIQRCKDVDRLKAWTNLLTAENALIKLDMRDHIRAGGDKNSLWMQRASKAKYAIGKRINACGSRIAQLKNQNHAD